MYPYYTCAVTLTIGISRKGNIAGVSSRTSLLTEEHAQTLFLSRWLQLLTERRNILKTRAVVSILLVMVSFESTVRVVGTIPRIVGSDCLLLHYGIRWLQIDRLMLVRYGIRLSTWIKRNANQLVVIT